MYCIEMYVEAGHWSKEFPTDERGVRRGKPRVSWVGTSGTWVLLGGRYADEAAADLAIVRFMACGSRQKPLRFRAYR